MNKISVSIQKTFLLLNALLLGYLGWGYFSSTFANSFPVLEKLFKPEIVGLCTPSGCWQSIVPFLGATYSSFVIISMLALLFRPGRELQLMIVGLASVHIVMGLVRLFVVPPEFYLEGAAMQASVNQFVLGGCLLASAALPYKTADKIH